MGGKSKSTSTQALTPNNDALLGNITRATSLADTPVTPYGGAPLDLSQPMGAAEGLLSFSAPNIGASSYSPTLMNRGDIRNVSTAAATQGELANYYNPYETQVVNGFLGDNERQRTMAINDGQARAMAAGAYGGSRHGVADSLTNGEYARTGANFASGLRAQGFNTALGAVQGDQNRRLAADTTNSGFDFGVASGNAGFQNQAGQFNAQQAQQAAMANQQAAIQSAGVQAQGAGLLGQFQQAAYDTPYAEFVRQQNDPKLNQQLLNQSYGLLYNGPLTSQKSSQWQITPPNVSVGA